MNTRLIFGLVFSLFFSYSFWVTLKTSYGQAFPPFTDLNTTQIFFDLAIALNIILYLMYQLLKDRNLPLWPLFACSAGMVLMGSLSPLLLLALYPGLHNRK